jgi:hypothetical protein
MSAAEQLRRCREQVERASAAFVDLRPESLENSPAILEAAVDCLSTFQAGLRDEGYAEALEEAWKLRAGICRARKLLDRAVEWHAGWADVLGLMTAGYGPGGVPAEAPRAGRIFLRA